MLSKGYERISFGFRSGGGASRRHKLANWGKAVITQNAIELDLIDLAPPYFAIASLHLEPVPAMC